MREVANIMGKGGGGREDGRGQMSLKDGCKKEGKSDAGGGNEDGKSVRKIARMNVKQGRTERINMIRKERGKWRDT